MFDMWKKDVEIIDFHCHYDLLPGFGAKELTIPSNIGIIAVTTTPLAWPMNNKVAMEQSNIIPGLGLHPQLVASRKKDFDKFKLYIDEAIIIGEVGLDGSKNFKDSLADQQEIFGAILDMCMERQGKILSIHSLKSETRIIDNFKQHISQHQFIPVLHWFTGSLPQAAKLLDMGARFSFNHKMVKTKRGIELLNFLPANVVLTETDLPFTSRSYTSATLGDALQNVVDSIAEHWHLPTDECKSMLLDNGMKLLKGT